MSKTYLLPCSCGARTAVGVQQAGQTLQCECGATLEVPTMRGLSRLEEVTEPIESRAVARRRSWGLRERLFFVGLLIAVPAFAFSGYFYYSLARFEHGLNALVEDPDLTGVAPAQTWQLWIRIQRDVPLSQSLQSFAVERVRRNWRLTLYSGIAVGICGLLLAGSGLLVRADRSAPPR
jgi:hypothetical protein